MSESDCPTLAPVVEAARRARSWLESRLDYPPDSNRLSPSDYSELIYAIGGVFKAYQEHRNGLDQTGPPAIAEDAEEGSSAESLSAMIAPVVEDYARHPDIEAGVVRLLEAFRRDDLGLLPEAADGLALKAVGPEVFLRSLQAKVERNPFGPIVPPNAAPLDIGRIRSGLRLIACSDDAGNESSGVEVAANGTQPASEAPAGHLSSYRLNVDDVEVAANGTQPAPEAPAGPLAELAYVFRPTGDTWHIRFGAEEGHFADIKGFGIIQKLLQQPNPQKPIHAIDLAGGDSTKPMGEQTVQAQLDNEALDSARGRLKEIEAEIRKAKDHENDAEVERLEKERDDIAEWADGALNVRGQSRPLGPASAAEKARVAVRNSIDRVYGKLEHGEPALPNLVTHFRQSIVTEGAAYAYRPYPRLDWHLG